MDAQIGKRRLIAIQEILYRHTDEQHSLSLPEIIFSLSERNIHADRKTVRADIALLAEMGMDIIASREKQTTYHIGARSFQFPELKLLIDAVAASKLLPQRKSEELIDTLASFASRYEAEQLHRYAYATGRPKSTNTAVLYIVDALHEAIHTRQIIEFQYIDYTPEKTKIFKHDGYVYRFSPYALLWNDDRHYALGYSEKHGRVITFRVDRMANVRLTGEPAVPAPSGFDAAAYAAQSINMYGGEECEMQLLCRNELMHVVVDRFGEDIPTEIVDAEHFTAAVRMCASPTFYAWVFQFGGGISILSPSQVVNEYIAVCQEAICAQNPNG